MEQQVQRVSVSRFNATITWVSRVMAAIAAVTLGVMMMVAVVDVCGRFFFNKPLEGSFELGGILLVTAGTWGMGYCQLRKGNIRIDVLTNRFPKKVQLLANILAYLVCIVAAGAVTWRTALMTHEYMFIERGGLTPTLLIPLWPFMLTLAMGFGWVTVIFLVDLIKTVREVVKR